ASVAGMVEEPVKDQADRPHRRADFFDRLPGGMPADLLLLHGFTQTGASWDGVSRALAGRYRALAPDLGAGPWEAELDRLEALAPPAFTLAGYSMGGRLALALAVRRKADEALATRIEAIGAEAFAREWAAQPLFAGQPPEVAAAAHEDRMR